MLVAKGSGFETQGRTSSARLRARGDHDADSGRAPKGQIVVQIGQPAEGVAAYRRGLARRRGAPVVRSWRVLLIGSALVAISRVQVRSSQSW